MSEQPIICLHHGDAWYYFLPSTYGRDRWVAIAAGHAGEDLASAGRARWFAGTFLAESIQRRTPVAPKTLAWELADESAASERFPRMLTVEEWAERQGTDEDSDFPERGLYRAVTEPQPDKVVVLEGPWQHADGEPAPPDGRTWVAKLPYELIQHSELLHLFPGSLQGFRAALVARLNTIPGVTAYDHATFEVYAKVPYDPPRHSWTGKGRSKRQVAEGLTRSQTFYPPREIPGATRASAAVAWDETIAKFVAVVSEMATVRPCGTCAGTGVAPHNLPGA